MALVTKLPIMTGDMAQWLAKSRALLLAALGELAPATFQVEEPTGFDGVDAAIYAEPDVVQHRTATVHAVKGESVGAVMLVAEEPDAHWKIPEAVNWASMLDEATVPTEEIRIFYVAVTRARRVLVLALPDSTQQLVINKYVAAGFKVRPA